jgi:prolyl 4-hydroxylase
MPRHPLLIRAIELSAAGRNSEAVAIIEQLAAQQVPEALHIYAEMTWRGGMVPQDPVRARELYRLAGEAGHSASAAFYTNLVGSGVAGERDWPLALRRLEKEAERDPGRRLALKLVADMKLTADGDPLSLPEGQALSGSPQVTLFRSLLSAAECDYLKQKAEPGYAPSMVNAAGGRLVQDPIRTSDGSTIHWLIEDPAVHALNRRLAAASGTSAEQGEALQILRYRPGQQYRPHLDFVQSSDNQRVLTALVYLNEDYAGGETCFIRTGLKVRARRGDAIVFRNATPDRAPDRMAEHAGLPVTSGTKFLASRWIREQRWAP